MAKTRSKKEKELADITSLISKYPVIGVINIEKMPAAQMQQIRKKLRGRVEMKVGRNALISIALKNADKSRPNFGAMKEYVLGSCGIVACNTDTFKLLKEMNATKMKMAARGGEVAPEDILIKSGETSLKPGPIVGELQKGGIPAAIEKGKVVIKQDKIIVKKGERISRDAALALARLDVFPLTVGLGLMAAYENGVIFGKDVLTIDEQKTKSDLADASRNAFNLAISLAYPARGVVEFLIEKAHTQAVNLSIRASIPTEQTIALMIQKACLEASIVKEKIKAG